MEWWVYELGISEIRLCHALLGPGGGDTATWSVFHGLGFNYFENTWPKLGCARFDQGTGTGENLTGHATWSYNLGQPTIPLEIDNASLDAKNGSYLHTTSSKLAIIGLIPVVFMSQRFDIRGTLVAHAPKRHIIRRTERSPSLLRLSLSIRADHNHTRYKVRKVQESINRFDPITLLPVLKT